MSLQARGTVTLPPALRKRYGLDTPGTQLEITEREDGVWEVRPMIAVPATEAWFWSPAWRAGEAEVDAHLARGEVTTSEGAEEFLADLQALSEEPAPAPAGADDQPVDSPASPTDAAAGPASQPSSQPNSQPGTASVGSSAAPDALGRSSTDPAATGLTPDAGPAADAAPDDRG